MTKLAVTKTRVVIIGAGFAGLEAAKILARDVRIELLVIDRNNFHLFQPLLYQVATAGLSPSEIAMPIRSVLKGRKNTTVLMAEVTKIDLKNNFVETSTGQQFGFDYLLVAPGQINSYFGNDGWSKFAPGLKTLDDATEIRRRILTAFEMAEQATDPVDRQAWTTFVVVGGGPTGLELAGAIAEIARFAVADEFTRFRTEDAKIYLLEGGPDLLGAFHKELRPLALKAISRLGVEVSLNTRVTGITSDCVSFEKRRNPTQTDTANTTLEPQLGAIQTKTILWAAGVRPSPLVKFLDAPKDQTGRILVNPDLSVPDYNHCFAVGDIAAFQNVPAMAPGAMQQGRHAAVMIQNDLDGRSRTAFKYIDKGSLATIGRAQAVCEFGAFRTSGLGAWLIWCFVHVFYLIGFHNRILVMLRWIWSYLTFHRGTRLIRG